MATPLDTRYCGDGFLCGARGGGGSLWCRRAIGHSKVVLQHQQGAAELRMDKREEKRSESAPAFRLQAWFYFTLKQSSNVSEVARASYLL